MNYKLKDDYIPLIKLLKSLKISQTGGHAKIIVEMGEVIVNGKVEYRKRAKIRAGDQVQHGNNKIEII